MFLGRRIARIVPLYWAMTTLFLLTLILTPGAVHGSVSNGFEILKSYFFIPYLHSGSDQMRPIYKLGWTPDYEMFFYLAFAAVLFLPVRMALYSLAAFFLGLVALGLVASISLAMLLHHWLERPMTKFSQKLLATPQAADTMLTSCEKA